MGTIRMERLSRANLILVTEEYSDNLRRSIMSMTASATD
jgi:hypothetical protein